MATDASVVTDDALARVVAALPSGGEARAGQRRMATLVAEAIASGRHLVVQAGTGTGKSLAYLVPAILSERKVVVATATKALQDQLATKDLPFLAEHLDVPVRFAVLKGRSNYLCLQRVREVQSVAAGNAPLVVPAFYWKLLAADGVAPELDSCVACGSPGPLVAFSVDEGGVLCRTCRRGAAVSQDAIALVRRILGGDLVAALREPGSTATHEVEVLAVKALEHHLERRLRSVALLEPS
jgi:hypothetical protein